LLYFDHNATHPLSPVARAAWLDAADHFPANPSSPHRLGERADRALNEARERLAGWLGCNPLEIVWTSGATEANNTAIAHLAMTRHGVALLSAIEHPCVRAATDRHFATRRAELRVSRDGVLDITAVDAVLGQDVAFVAVMAANNETGVLQPWREVAALCRENDVPFLCDAAQWVGRLPMGGLGECDFVTGCAHKFGGPPGVGFLKCPANLRALIVGGPQEGGRRAGTENVPGVLAMVATLAERESHIPKRAALIDMREGFIENLTARIRGARVIASDAPRLWNTVSVVMPEAPDCRQRWVVKLDKLGCAVSTGSACSSGKEQPSHVLRAMGLKPDEAGRVLRLSSGWETTQQDWDKLLDALVQAAEEITKAPAQ
jgi:cysteine desulfurase